MSAYLSARDFGVTVGITDTVILGANIGRRSFTVSPPAAGRVTVTFGHAAVIDQGSTIYAGTAPRTWHWDDFGEMIRSEIHAIADAAGRNVGVLETSEPRS